MFYTSFDFRKKKKKINRSPPFPTVPQRSPPLPQGRSGMVGSGEGWCGSVRDGGAGEGRECHDDRRSATMGHDDLKMVTGR